MGGFTNLTYIGPHFHVGNGEGYRYSYAYVCVFRSYKQLTSNYASLNF